MNHSTTRTTSFVTPMISSALALMLITLGACSSSPRMQEAHPAAMSTPIPAAALYEKHCSTCHGTDRLGKTGPALFAENLDHVKKKDLVEVISRGRKNTQMPGFENQLNANEVEAMIQWISAPVSPAPTWSDADIKNSIVRTEAANSTITKPTFKADPLNLFCVVELGDHAITVLDGDRFEPLTRFKTRFAVHGGIKYSLDGRYAFAASRDGWVTKFDIYQLKIVGEVRVGINTRNIALSSDGRYLVAGNTLPRNLVFLNAQTLEPIKSIPTVTQEGAVGRVGAVYVAPPRKSFIVALRDVPELWEVSYQDGARKPYTGLVHDYKTESGEDLSTTQELFPVRRIPLEGNKRIDDVFFDPEYKTLIGASRDGKEAQIVNLIVGRIIGQLPIQGMPHLASGIAWKRKGHVVLATPNLKDGLISVIDTTNWKPIENIKTLGPGFFLRSHEKSPYAWADVFFGKDKDAVHVIDKKSLQIVKTLRPAPGKIAAHVEFTRNGKYALLSIWDEDGAIVVYDSHTLREVKRIPMRKPSGKYNVYNKIHFSDGTSH